MRTFPALLVLALAASGCASQTAATRWQTVIARAADAVPLTDPQWTEQVSARTGVPLRQVQSLGDRLVVLEMQCGTDEASCTRALDTLRDSGAFTLLQPDGVRRLNPPPARSAA